MNDEKIFNNYYQTLNKAQKEAVDTIEGPVMVVAGPGTGKTTILGLRITNILRKTDISPENILALTFTNSGVVAMRKKLLEYIGDSAYRVNIFTFHSFAENIIKEHSFYFKKLEFANVITDLEKVQVLEKIIDGGDFEEIVSNYDVFSSLSNVKKAIDDLKQEGISPEELKNMIPEWKDALLRDESIYYKKKYGKHNAGDIKPTEEKKIEKIIAKVKEVQVVFEEYQKEIERRGLYDFSDMILYVLKELKQNENLKLDLQEKYQYLMVDEHQDTNDGQNQIIEYLTDAPHLDGHPNIFTVGDEKQSIYRFQGASSETFSHFQKIYKDVEIINLDQNYRSTKDILNSSRELILNSVPETVELESNIDFNRKIEYQEFSNYKFELLWLSQSIKDQIKKGLNPAEIAVIYRSNSDVLDIKNIFNLLSIPHTIISKDKLLDDKNILNLIYLLKTISNFNDSHSLAKSLFVDFLDFDSYDVVSILKKYNLISRKSNISLFEVISNKKHLEDLELQKKDLIVDFIKKLKDLKKKSENSTFTAFFKDFLNEIGYLDFMLQAKDNRDQLLKIDKLFDEIKKQAQNKKEYSLQDFVVFVDAYDKYNLDIETNNPEVVEGVKLMTAHKSKGLEFEAVYIFDATRKKWEKRRGVPSITLPIKDYKGDVNDERRLFYVAMTRAKKHLYISSSLTDWQGREQEKTQFLAEVGFGNLKITDTKKFEENNLDKLFLFIKKSEEEKSFWNKEYLKQRFLESKLSVTALNNYVKCPVRYLFRNLIRLPSDYTPSLLFGDLIHKSLESFFDESKKSEKILSKEELIKIFEEKIDNSSMYGNEYKRYKKRGEELLSEYFDQYNKEWSINISNEENISRDFILDNEEKITLHGIIDKICFVDKYGEGDIEIVDYKTGRTYSDKGKEDREALKRQIIFYHLLLDGYKEGKLHIKKATLDFLEKNKKGNFEPYNVDVSEEDRENLKETINQMAKEVTSGEFIEKGCGKRECQFCQLKKNI
ncbi:ATP-dependent helicase [Candidatus Nomurabacteria bacterium]|nr:ATP-dependent helicase [Candidatus Nomurabacteria bacterium]